MNHIHAACKNVREILLHKAVEEEKQKTAEETNIRQCTNLTVSGDGTWKTRGFSSLYGVASLIGNFTSKVVDIITKSSFCKACSQWSGKEETTEFDEWYREHEKNCLSNHQGSAGKMEVDSMVEMFQRSQKLYGVRYKNYIGDGDSKTYSNIVSSKPYGNSFLIKKKECIGHVQKKMGRKLRELKKKQKGLGGRNKLTGSLIDKLSVYYGLAIRRNHDSVINMKNAIWATFYHISSTDKKPEHHLCPTGSNSWCAWQRAKAEKKLKYFKHDKILHEDVVKAIKPIYEDLSKEELLEKCLSGYTQNNNESLNNLFWKIAPKISNCGSKIVDIASYAAACIFNEGTTSLIQIMNDMDISVGINCYNYTTEEGQRRMSQAEFRTLESTKEARVARRQAKTHGEMSEDQYYGAGIDI